MITRTKLVVLTTIVAASLTLGIVAASGATANIFLTQSAFAQSTTPPGGSSTTPTTPPGDTATSGNSTSGNSTSGNVTK